MSAMSELRDRAKVVLETNRQGNYTVPAKGIYPHQWSWDSCFTAIGLRHYDIKRAQQELEHLVRAQWKNGMIPHMVLAHNERHVVYFGVWQSWLSPYSPDRISTSGITQPPMLAEAVVRIGEKLPVTERRLWYKRMWPHLLAYHQWLYGERDPHAEGLATLLHPYESGMDNSPVWIAAVNRSYSPLWVKLAAIARFDRILGRFRSDVSLPPEQRMATTDGLALYALQLRLRHDDYDSLKILQDPAVAVQDLAFNAILIRANTHLRHIAKSILQPIPPELDSRMQKAKQALENLWDPTSQQYFSRNVLTSQLIKVPSIAGLLPLYAGSISKERAAQLVARLENEKEFGTAFPTPSVPANSRSFDPLRYWQGPSWANINWLVIDGLKRYGYTAHAEALRESTIEMVRDNSFYEYFHPFDGGGLGTPNFSWTAALIIDLLA